MRKASNIPTSFSFIFFLIVLLVSLESVFGAAPKSRMRNVEPCNRLLLHLHGITWANSSTTPNATTAAVTKLGLANYFGSFMFGELDVYDNPVTLDENMSSPPAARARGFFLYDRKDTFNTLFLITLTFNSSEHTGTLIMLGNNEHQQKNRDIAVVGGTGDFFLARGITTIETGANDVAKSYYRLKMDIKLYECY